MQYKILSLFVLLTFSRLIGVKLFASVALILGILLICPFCAFVSILHICRIILWCDFFL